MARGKHYDVDPTPQNFRAIWDQLHQMNASLASAQDTITQQQTTIDSLNSQLAAASQTAQQAAILAGKAVQAATQTANTGSGGSTPPASGDTHPNHYATVVAAKADLITAGVSLVGPCGAFEITKRVAQYLAPSEPSVGLLDKPTGNNCGGYAVDIICYNDGLIYDILIDAGGANDPAWSFSGQVPVSRYRPPI